LIPWPGSDDLHAEIERDLGPSISSKMCVSPGKVEVTLDNVSVGHAWPSGVTHARRAWVELVARQGGQIVYESGVVAAGEDPADLTDSPWLMSSRFLGSDGAEVAMAWQAATEESNVLAPSVTTDPQDARFFHAVTRTFQVPAADQIELHVRITPIGASVIRSLESSGDLEPGFAASVPVFELAPIARRWEAADGFGCAAH
jgi:hypothetical protein